MEGMAEEAVGTKKSFTDEPNRSCSAAPPRDGTRLSVKASLATYRGYCALYRGGNRMGTFILACHLLLSPRGFPTSNGSIFIYTLGRVIRFVTLKANLQCQELLMITLIAKSIAVEKERSLTIYKTLCQRRISLQIGTCMCMV